VEAQDVSKMMIMRHQSCAAVTDDVDGAMLVGSRKLMGLHTCDGALRAQSVEKFLWIDAYRLFTDQLLNGWQGEFLIAVQRVPRYIKAAL
jgi:hypothetical protein